MTIDGQATDEITTGVDRRAALKKAAIAAGVVAWTTPAVQAVTARPVHAQGVTGCAPVLTVTAKLTGSGCKCQTAPSACCDNNTFFIVPALSDCGPTCPGVPVVEGLVITTLGGEKPGCPIQAFQRLACLGNPPTGVVNIKATVTCPNSNVFQLNQNVTVNCVICAVAAAVEAAEEDFLPESLDVTEETPPGVVSPPPEEPVVPPPQEPVVPPPQESSPPVSVAPAGETDTSGSAPP